MCFGVTLTCTLNGPIYPGSLDYALGWKIRSLGLLLRPGPRASFSCPFSCSGQGGCLCHWHHSTTTAIQGIGLPPTVQVQSSETAPRKQGKLSLNGLTFLWQAWRWPSSLLVSRHCWIFHCEVFSYLPSSHQGTGNKYFFHSFSRQGCRWLRLESNLLCSRR